GLALADLIDEQMRKRGLTLVEVANQLRAIGKEESYSCASKQLVCDWRRGKVTPGLLHRRLIARLFDLPVEVVMAKAEEQNDLRAYLKQAKSKMKISENSSVDRRDFLFLPPLGAMTCIGYPDWNLEATDTNSLGRPGRLDKGILEGFANSTRLYIQQMHILPPRMLLPNVRRQLILMQQHFSGSGPLKRELLTLAAENAALAGKLSFSLGNYGEALEFYRSAGQVAADTGHTNLRAYVLGQSSHLHSSFWGTGIGSPVAQKLLDEAKAMCGKANPSFLAAWLAVRSAEEHAAVGDSRATNEDLESAQEVMGRVPSFQDEWGFFRHWEIAPIARMDGYRGNCERALGRPAAAAEIIEQAVTKVEPTFAHVRTSMLADLASAHSRKGEVEQACTVATEALRSATQAGLLSNLQRLTGVRRELTKWNNLPVVKQFDDQLRQSVERSL
ncbi:MAG: hypothetical protein ACREN8_13095, partial [Candidatus Dormibacteraceae bacterium]